jgi:hypothetical protein
VSIFDSESGPTGSPWKPHLPNGHGPAEVERAIIAVATTE